MGEDYGPGFYGLWGKDDQKLADEKCEHNLLCHHLGSA